MIKTYNIAGQIKVKFKGDAKTIKHDMVRIMWSMIEHSTESRQVLIEAIEEINWAVKQMEKEK